MNEMDGHVRSARPTLQVARQDTGQARRVANFLPAWHNAEENGGWDPVDLWNVGGRKIASKCLPASIADTA